MFRKTLFAAAAAFCSLTVLSAAVASFSINAGVPVA